MKTSGVSFLRLQNEFSHWSTDLDSDPGSVCEKLGDQLSVGESEESTFCGFKMKFLLGPRILEQIGSV